MTDAKLQKLYRTLMDLTPKERAVVIEFLARHHEASAVLSAALEESGPTPGDGGGTGQ